jgi:hypothetical protein
VVSFFIDGCSGDERAYHSMNCDFVKDHVAEQQRYSVSVPGQLRASHF